MRTKMQLFVKLMLGLLMAPSLMAADYSCKKDVSVLQRVGVTGHEILTRDINSLLCENGVATKFDGKHFKIVAGKGKEAIKFSDNPDLVKKASNVYYHLMYARNFWIHTVGSDYVKNMEQIVIRVDITNQYSRFAHFKDEEHGENFNNAWTINPGKTPSRAPVQDEWGIEVWFAPPKSIPTSELVSSYGDNPVSHSLRELKDPVVGELTGDIERDIIRRVIEQKEIIHSNSFQELVINNLIIHTAYTATLWIADKTDLLFLEDEFVIDTAMVPDIIYHEYSHVALSDKLELRYYTPVIEGMADYFATRIADAKFKMFNKIEGISTNRNKDPHNKTFYSPRYEDRDLSDRDFVLSLLWTVRKDLDAANEKRAKEGKGHIVDIDKLMYQARMYLNKDADINTKLGKALIQACRKVCKRSAIMAGNSIILRALEKKGL